MSVQSNVRAARQRHLPKATRPADADGTPLRFVSAASLFDGHDAAINIIRRLLQSHGAEVVHLGHNRSVADIVRAAIQEDADGIACSSYQGGHNEYFHYMVDMLREHGAEHIRIVVGGGGTIAPHEVGGTRGLWRRADLHAGGRPQARPRRHDRRRLRARAQARANRRSSSGRSARATTSRSRARFPRWSRTRPTPRSARRCSARWRAARASRRSIGITGTGGAGKSSLTDELLMRFVRHFPDRNVAVVAMDPTRRRSGGALLGDRIRMNSLAAEQVFMRSLATRRAAPRHQRGARRRAEPAQVRGLRPDRDRDRRHRPERLRDRRPGRRARCTS